MFWTPSNDDFDYGSLFNYENELGIPAPVAWYLSLPGLTGGSQFKNIMSLGDRDGNHGVLTNGPAWGGPMGRPGGFGSLSFDGTDDWVNAGSSSSLNPPAMSGFIWANLSTAATGDWHILLGRWEGGIHSYHFSMRNGAAGNNPRVLVAASGGNVDVTSSSAITLGRWHHVGFTYSSVAGLTLYLDSIQVGNAAAAGTIIATSLVTGIGAKGDATQPFIGNLDYSIIFDRVISASEVVALYNDSRLGCLQTINRVRYSTLNSAGAPAGNRRRRVICGAAA